MSRSQAPERCRVAIVSLVPSDSPRLVGEDDGHARVLAESEAALPPILVHRASMRVIDGMHRLQAARIREQDTIEVEFFDGSEADAFVEAVRANVTHGLPLTLADRIAAATRIIASHPDYSDRSIAAITGLAARTVAASRRRAGADDDHREARRIGRDGRVRPLSSERARRQASDTLTQNPRASLREVARATGLSPATVRDVRERIRRGEDPVPPRQRNGHAERKPQLAGTNGDSGRAAGARDRKTLLQNLSNDPSLRFSEAGRELLRWLFARASGPDGWEKALEPTPPHCAYVVVELARSCASEWSAFADELEQQLRTRA